MGGEEAILKIVELLEQVVEMLAGLSVPVWGFLIRQQVIGGIFGLVTEAAVLVATPVFGRKVLRWNQTRELDNNSFERSTVSGWAWVVMVVVVFLTLLAVSTSVSQLINPEFYAMEYLLNKMLRGQ